MVNPRYHEYRNLCSSRGRDARLLYQCNLLPFFHSHRRSDPHLRTVNGQNIVYLRSSWWESFETRLRTVQRERRFSKMNKLWCWVRAESGIFFLFFSLFKVSKALAFESAGLKQHCVIDSPQNNGFRITLMVQRLSISATPPPHQLFLLCNFSERELSQHYIIMHAYFNTQVFRTWHCDDVTSFVHYIWQIVTDLGSVLHSETAPHPTKCSFSK